MTVGFARPGGKHVAVRNSLTVNALTHGYIFEKATRVETVVLSCLNSSSNVTVAVFGGARGADMKDSEKGKADDTCRRYMGMGDNGSTKNGSGKVL